MRKPLRYPQTPAGLLNRSPKRSNGHKVIGKVSISGTTTRIRCSCGATMSEDEFRVHSPGTSTAIWVPRK